MNTKKDPDYARRGIEVAQEISQNRGFAIGDLAGFKDDPRGSAWKIKELRGDMALLHLPDGTETEVALSKLYDPNIARRQAIQAQTRDLVEELTPPNALN